MFTVLRVSRFSEIGEDGYLAKRCREFWIIFPGLLYL